MNREDLAEKFYLEEPHIPTTNFGYCKFCGDEILEEDYYYEYGEKWHPICYYIMKKGEEEREQNMKYKVGDRVKIREDLISGEKYGRYYLVNMMAELKGRHAKITDVLLNSYELDILPERKWWTDEMLEGVDMKRYRLRASGTIHSEYLHKFGSKYILLNKCTKDSAYQTAFTKEEILALPEKWMQHLEWVEVEELKYYLKAKEMRSNMQYLNKVFDEYVTMGSPGESSSHKTKFTETEIEDLPEWCQHLERILVKE